MDGRKLSARRHETVQSTSERCLVGDFDAIAESGSPVKAQLVVVDGTHVRDKRAIGRCDKFRVALDLLGGKE